MRSERNSELTFGIPALAQLRNCSEDARQLGLNENGPLLLHPIDEQVSAMARRFGRHCATVPSGRGSGNRLVGACSSSFAQRSGCLTGRGEPCAADWSRCRACLVATGAACLFLEDGLGHPVRGSSPPMATGLTLVGGSTTGRWFRETLSRGQLVGTVGGNRRLGRFCAKEK